MPALRDLLGAYEVTKEPVMTPPGLRWAPYVSVAVRPYRVTRLPRCRVHGLHAALVQAHPDLCGSRTTGAVEAEGPGEGTLDLAAPRGLRRRLPA